METQANSTEIEEKHQVSVTVDGQHKAVQKGKYEVSAFKAIVGVNASKELDEVIKGQLTPLEDTGTIHVKGEEVFVSHVRTGGAS